MLAGLKMVTSKRVWTAKCIAKAGVKRLCASQIKKNTPPTPVLRKKGEDVLDEEGRARRDAEYSGRRESPKRLM